MKNKKNKIEKEIYLSDVEDNISELKCNIEDMLKNIDFKPEDYFPTDGMFPADEIKIEVHDYEKDIERIKDDAKETLECLANLYLSEEIMKTKNIHKIIKEDSINLAKLNFSIEMSQRALISCMKQIDLGFNEPELFQAIAMFQKELRESIKMVYELQKKMKEFYKELKDELKSIYIGEEIKDDVINDNNNNLTVITDQSMLNILLEKIKNEENKNK